MAIIPADDALNGKMPQTDNLMRSSPAESCRVETSCPLPALFRLRHLLFGERFVLLRSLLLNQAFHRLMHLTIIIHYTKTHYTNISMITIIIVTIIVILLLFLLSSLILLLMEISKNRKQYIREPPLKK